MTSTIPASAVVNVNPQVVGAGGSGLVLNGMVLTDSWRVPINTPELFPSATAVADFFGATSKEAIIAADYFSGFINSNVKPGGLYFAQYNQLAVAAWMMGGDLSAMTLVDLKAIPAVTLTVTFGGTAITSGSIDLSAATSFSNAAAIIAAAFTTPPFTVTFDSTKSAFVFTSTSTGATSTVGYATTGTIATALMLTQATGATLSQGADASASPAAFMNALINQATNWATFMLAIDPDAGSGNTLKYDFAVWNSQQNNRYAFVCWDTDITPTQSTSASTSLGQLCKTNSVGGTILLYAPDYNHAAFMCGSIASIDFTQRNGRTDMMFKAASGAVPSVTDQTTAQNLNANGYNYLGSYAAAANSWTFFAKGVISGIFEYIDSYVNQIWMNNNFQVALLNMLTQVKAVPYNPAGFALVEAALLDPINQAALFGAFVPGVVLSDAQIAEVNYAAGLAIDKTLSSQGYYLQVAAPSAATRAARGSPIVNFWYMDGGSIHQINMASTLVQ